MNPLARVILSGRQGLVFQQRRVRMHRLAVVLAALILWPVNAWAQSGQVVEYYHTDVLGSVRVVTNAQGAVVSRHDFVPFGEEVAPQSPPPDRRLFTGKERDPELGFDYFEARYHAAPFARFTTPDPGHINGNLDDPQSWNAYAYARNNPLRYTDPDGLRYTVCAVNASCTEVSDEDWERAMRNPGGQYRFDHGTIWAMDDGIEVVAGFYWQTSVDPVVPTFDAMIHNAGELGPWRSRFGLWSAESPSTWRQ